jgi:hypothetical protein
MDDEHRFSFKDVLLWPFVLLLQMSPYFAFILLTFFVSLCGFLYYTVNSDFWGLFAPPFEEMTFSADFSKVLDTKDHRTWKITYEASPFSSFHGVVRHVSNWRDEPIPFATHDILITTGEFASSARVSTRVVDHSVTFQWFRDPKPVGSINLLHIVPKNKEIYRQLLEVREWNQVTISGREIFRIDLFDPAGKFLSYWQDQGCNSILVTSVKIDAPGTPVP